MKECINNSIVGTSKFLHFVNPENYPIWDSRVYSSITGKKNSQNHVNNVNNYIVYANRMRELSNLNEIERLKEILLSKGYCNEIVSNIRVLELILFYTSPKLPVSSVVS
jgi:hypothetical protein